MAAQEEARRAACLTHRLLAFSRRQTLDPKPTDVAALVGALHGLLKRTLGPLIELDVATDPATWASVVDGNQLESVLLNLCINARDAMPDGGHLAIVTHNERLARSAAQELDLEPGSYVKLCVTDTGAGMSEEVIARAFEPFFTTKPTGRGTGLGLSMACGFARQTGGQIRITSEVGAGACVSIYLPRYDGAVVRSAAPAGGVGTIPAGRGETVLVVDDEPIVRALIVASLSGAGYRTLEAGDGAAGLQILWSDTPIDLLVADFGLEGGLDGVRIAEAARASRPDLKMVFITGYAAELVFGDDPPPGMTVIGKPFAMTTLAAEVQALLNGT